MTTRTLNQHRDLLTPQQKGELFVYFLIASFLISFILLSFVFIHSYGGWMGQKTFGRPDLDHLEHVMEDLLAGNYWDLKISYTSKEGTKVNVELKGF